MPRLVPDWRDAWRWYSTHCLAIAFAMQATWLELPPEFKALAPDWLIHAMTMLALVCGFVGRLLDQPQKASP
ncbi:hypothetical protein [Solimonas flava]|uniref:DUF7940 domain-containing protein n=1 Tax=Solimonas flava TaxID=415849 RepID=UPI00041476EF|nr:hypothetical protein [Solimonas flava]